MCQATLQGNEYTDNYTNRNKQCKMVSVRAKQEGGIYYDENEEII